MSGPEAIWVLRAFEGLTLLVGAGIAYVSLRAYARSHDPSLAWLGAGFILVTIASAVAGVLYEVTTHDLLTAWTVSAAIDFVGFGLILYSILRPRPGTPDSSPLTRSPAPSEVAPTGPPGEGGNEGTGR